MMTFRLLCRCLFLLLAAEPVLVIFKTSVKRIKEYRATADTDRKKELRELLYICVVGEIFAFCVFAFIVYNYM